MTIPKSYEALAADLASEKILSKTLQGQKESYMMLADQRKFELDGAIHRESLSDKHLGLALEREDALREELAALRESYEAMRDRKNSIVYLQQRLTVAEHREADLKKLLCDVINEAPTGFAALKVDLANRVNDALKPAADAGLSSSEFTKKSGKSARAPVGLKKDQIVEVFGGGQTQIARVDKTDWRHVEMWRVKP